MPAENTKIFIVDASFVLAFLMPDESNLQSDKIFNQFKAGTIKLYTSPLLPYEIANSLRVAIMRKRINLKYAQDRLDEFLEYEIVERLVDFKTAFNLSHQHNLTVSDASYLYLSQTQGFELLTLDTKLKSLA